MEAHPIPQNVTAFEFHLVGDMTLKQFLYLSLGVGLAYLIFVFLTPVTLLAWPLVLLFALLGVAFAFLGVADRPLDHWLMTYLKAIFSPTQRIWNKAGQDYKSDPAFASRLAIFWQNFFLSTPIPTPVKPPPAAPISISPLPLPANPPPPIKTTPTAPAPTPIESGPAPSPAPVKVVTPTKVKTPQITLTTQPNVINGIVLDSNNNYLEGVVVVIFDKSNLPVRALKTNKLGQFSGSTPLPSGTYLIELEKDNLVFDKLQIELKGNLLPPLAISAKKLIGG